MTNSSRASAAGTWIFVFTIPRQSKKSKYRVDSSQAEWKDILHCINKTCTLHNPKVKPSESSVHSPWQGDKASQTQVLLPAPCNHHHYHDDHHQLSLHCEDRSGTSDDFTTTFLHFSLFPTALRDVVNYMMKTSTLWTKSLSSYQPQLGRNFLSSPPPVKHQSIDLWHHATIPEHAVYTCTQQWLESVNLLCNCFLSVGKSLIIVSEQANQKTTTADYYYQHLDYAAAIHFCTGRQTTSSAC